jgi:biopolymer transport protein ExbB
MQELHLPYKESSMSRLTFLYENTGYVGIALIILALVSLYLFIKNSLYLRWVYRDFLTYFSGVEQGVSSNPLIGIIQGVATSHATHSKDLRSEVAYLFHRHFQNVAGGLTALRLISVISPLLGLMGTVLGMVKVFRVIAPDQC